MKTTKTIPQPLDVIEKLREAIKPLGFEIYGFGRSATGCIALEIGDPQYEEYGFWGKNKYVEHLKETGQI